jgi:signal transduction histidine kinase
MPLRLRLALLFAAATTAVVGVAGAVFVLQLNDSLDDALDGTIDARLVALADRMTLSGVGDLQMQDSEEPVQILSPTGRVEVSSHVSGTPMVTVAQIRELGGGQTSGEPLPPSFVANARSPEPRPSTIHFTTTSGDERTRIGATKAANGDVLVIGMDTEIADVAADRIERAMFFGGPPAILVAGLGAWVLAGAALRPVARMSRQAAEISAHDSATTLAVPKTNDEIAILARTMNDLLGRLRAALASERRFVSDASHELRTPLTTLSAELELAARPGRSLQDLQRAISAARADTDHLGKLATDLLLLAQAQSDQPLLYRSDLDVGAVAEAAASDANLREQIRPGASRSAERVTVRKTDCAVPSVVADPDRLRQVFDNLLDNATRHDPHGPIEIDIQPRGDNVVTTIRDHGPGFPPDFIPHAFQRFRRADGVRGRADGGTGLGLSIAAALIHAHGGTITAANHPDGGAVLTVELPNQPEL